MSVKSSASKASKKSKVHYRSGRVYIRSTFNNTLVHITDLEGNLLCASTCGERFSNSRKSTPYAAQLAATSAATKARTEFGMTSVEVILRGHGPGRDAAVKALSSDYRPANKDKSSDNEDRYKAEPLLKVVCIIDDTGIPHNGCRGEKERRV